LQAQLAGTFLNRRMMVKNFKIGSKWTQYIFETSSWVRLIDFMHQENSFLKTRLSEVMDDITSSENLALAEHFQNQFIVKDDVYDHMKHDLQRHIEKWSQLTAMEESNQVQTLKKIHGRLKEQIDYIERDHTILRKDYNTYLISLSVSAAIN
jgi:phosphoenolpyruvate carboxylase